MEPTAHLRKTVLPGVGARYDLATEDGVHLSVVIKHDGGRVLGFQDPDDDDVCRDAARLAPHEARALATLLAPEGPAAHLHDSVVIDLVTEHIPITSGAPYSGRTLGDTRARTRTGASIVAVIRRTAAVPSPTPDFRFATGDILVVVGTREGVDAVADLIAGG
jgi:TrkA domain protein